VAAATGFPLSFYILSAIRPGFSTIAGASIVPPRRSGRNRPIFLGKTAADGTAVPLQSPKLWHCRNIAIHFVDGRLNRLKRQQLLLFSPCRLSRSQM
jgi:hypothetical protein